MNELICEFADIKQAGENLVQAAETFRSEITSFSSTIDSDLAGWNGNAKNAFSALKEAQIQASTAVCDQAEAVGNFIKSCSEAIEALETDLSTASI